MFSTILKQYNFLFLSLSIIILIACEPPTKPELTEANIAVKIPAATGNNQQTTALKVKKVFSLEAKPKTRDNGGLFTKFSFAKGTAVTGDDWDIALRGTNILVNGGQKTGIAEEPDKAIAGKAAAYIFKGTMENVKTIDKSKFKQDKNSSPAIPKGSGNGWYNYNFISHAISPIPGKILIFRTHDGKYAKMRIVNYYNKGKQSGYYTFNYVYQPDEKATSFYTATKVPVSTVSEKPTSSEQTTDPASASPVGPTVDPASASPGVSAVDPASASPGVSAVDPASASSGVSAVDPASTSGAPVDHASAVSGSALLINENPVVSEESLIEKPTSTSLEIKRIHSLDVTRGIIIRGPLKSGAFTKFSFAKGTTVEGDDWDIAFRGSKILVNGGKPIGTQDEPIKTGDAAAYIFKGTMEDAKSIDKSKFKQDDGDDEPAIRTGSGNGWYSYSGFPDHVMSPIPGRILIFRTHDGKYAKMEILYCYKDAKPPVPQDPNFGHYTFDYVYQPDEKATSF